MCWYYTNLCETTGQFRTYSECQSKISENVRCIHYGYIVDEKIELYRLREILLVKI